MTITTKIKAGDLPQTIPLPEGQSLTLKGSDGAAGVAYLLDQVLGGTNSLKSWTVSSGTLAPIGPYSGTQQFLITCTAGSIDASVGDAVLVAAQNKTPNFGRFLAIGDSRTFYGSPLREPGIFDGRTKYITTGSINAAWIPAVIMDGSAATNATGTLASDSTGRLRWNITGDTAGSYVDVSNGGWFYLQSGTSPAGLFVFVIASTAPTLNGSATITATGLPTSWDYDVRGHLTWIAGGLGDTFADYQAYGISGCLSSDVLKFLPQVFASSAEAAYLQVGINDIPNAGATTAQRDALIANLKSIIDYCSTRLSRLYVGEIFAAAVKDATGSKYVAQANSAVRAYCRNKRGVRFVQSDSGLVTFSTTVPVSRTGCYSDDLHLLAYGGYKAAAPVVAAIKQDYPSDTQRRSPLDAWDATLQTGCINPNPNFVGSGGGTATGVSGVVPASWSYARAGSTQTLTGANVAATDGGPDWYSMSVTGATSGDYHVLRVTGIAVPAGIAVGDYLRLSCEIQFGAMTSPGIALLTIFASNTSALNNITLHQLQPNNNINTFSAELPTLQLASEPQKLLDLTTLSVSVRIGGAVGGGGTILIRSLRLEKASGPIYP